MVSVMAAMCFLGTSTAWSSNGGPGTSTQRLKGQIKAEDILAMEIPSSWGIIRDSYNSGTNQLIINIQDAHCDFEAQQNISKILDRLAANYALKLIALEAASGEVSNPILSNFPDKKIRENVSLFMVKEGKLTGAEHLVATSDYGLKLYGVEDMGLYLDNLEAFRESQPFKSGANQLFAVLKDALNTLKIYVYNTKLKEIDNLSRDYQKRRVSFDEYAVSLYKMLEENNLKRINYPTFYELQKVIRLEAKVDFRKADKERTRLIEELTEVMNDPTDITSLVENSLNFKKGLVSQAEFASFLKDMAFKLRINLSSYPQFSMYVEYIVKYEEVANEKLFKELARINDDIRNAFYQDEDQEELDRLDKNLDTLIKLVNLKMITTDIDYFFENREKMSSDAFVKFIQPHAYKHNLVIKLPEEISFIDVYLPAWAKFYELADMRDMAFVEKTLSRMEYEGVDYAALVTGGFHTEQLTRILKNKNISYLVISPRASTSDANPYINIMQGGTPLLEQFVKQLESTLGVFRSTDNTENLSAEQQDLVNKLQGSKGSESKAELLGLAAQTFASVAQDSPELSDAAIQDQVLKVFSNFGEQMSFDEQTSSFVASAIVSMSKIKAGDAILVEVKTKGDSLVYDPQEQQAGSQFANMAPGAIENKIIVLSSSGTQSGMQTVDVDSEMDLILTANPKDLLKSIGSPTKKLLASIVTSEVALQINAGVQLPSQIRSKAKQSIEKKLQSNNDLAATFSGTNMDALIEEAYNGLVSESMNKMDNKVFTTHTIAKDPGLVKNIVLNKTENLSSAEVNQVVISVQAVAESAAENGENVTVESLETAIGTAKSDISAVTVKSISRGIIAEAAAQTSANSTIAEVIANDDQMVMGAIEGAGIQASQEAKNQLKQTIQSEVKQLANEGQAITEDLLTTKISSNSTVTTDQARIMAKSVINNAATTAAVDTSLSGTFNNEKTVAKQVKKEMNKETVKVQMETPEKVNVSTAKQKEQVYAASAAQIANQPQGATPVKIADIASGNKEVSISKEEAMGITLGLFESMTTGNTAGVTIAAALNDAPALVGAALDKASFDISGDQKSVIEQAVTDIANQGLPISAYTIAAGLVSNPQVNVSDKQAEQIGNLVVAEVVVSKTANESLAGTIVNDNNDTDVVISAFVSAGLDLDPQQQVELVGMVKEVVAEGVTMEPIALAAGLQKKMDSGSDLILGKTQIADLSTALIVESGTSVIAAPSLTKTIGKNPGVIDSGIAKSGVSLSPADKSKLKEAIIVQSNAIATSGQGLTAESLTKNIASSNEFDVDVSPTELKNISKSVIAEAGTQALADNNIGQSIATDSGMLQSAIAKADITLSDADAGLKQLVIAQQEQVMGAQVQGSYINAVQEAAQRQGGIAKGQGFVLQGDSVPSDIMKAAASVGRSADDIESVSVAPGAYTNEDGVVIKIVPSSNSQKIRIEVSSKSVAEENKAASKKLASLTDDLKTENTANGDLISLTSAMVLIQEMVDNDIPELIKETTADRTQDTPDKIQQGSYIVIMMDAFGTMKANTPVEAGKNVPVRVTGVVTPEMITNLSKTNQIVVAVDNNVQFNAQHFLTQSGVDLNNVEIVTPSNIQEELNITNAVTPDTIRQVITARHGDAKAFHFIASDARKSADFKAKLLDMAKSEKNITASFFPDTADLIKENKVINVDVLLADAVHTMITGSGQPLTQKQKDIYKGVVRAVLGRNSKLIINLSDDDIDKFMNQRLTDIGFSSTKSIDSVMTVYAAAETYA